MEKVEDASADVGTLRNCAYNQLQYWLMIRVLAKKVRHGGAIVVTTHADHSYDYAHAILWLLDNGLVSNMTMTSHPIDQRDTEGSHLQQTFTMTRTEKPVD